MQLRKRATLSASAKSTKKSLASTLFKEYSDSSTIHGVKYLGGPNRTWPERIWWIIVFSLSIFMCVILIKNTYMKWSTDPVIVSFSETATPVWHIPFPAVTICPMNMVRQSIFNFTKILTELQDERFKQLKPEDINQLRVLSLICWEYNLEQLNKINDFMVNFMTEDCYNLFAKVAVNEDELIDMIYFKRSNTTKISFTFTETGLCFSFNMMSNEKIFRDNVVTHQFKNENLENVTEVNWTPENGFSKNSKISDYPFRTVIGGAGNSLEIGLTMHPRDYDFLCEGPFQGYSIFLHTPVEVPSHVHAHIRIPSNQETVVMLKPNLLRTTNALRSYPPNGRQCYYETERYLKFFRVYTQRNCEMECVTNYTLAKCGCSTFFLPRKLGTKICGPGKFSCSTEASENLNNIALDGVRDPAASDDEIPNCNCLPSCTSLIYEAETSYADIGFKNYHRTKTYFASGTKHNMSYAFITIFFKEDQFISMKRAELFGKTEFMANCGGLLGLFMGVSLLSFVEIIYFCTIRLIYSIQSKKKIVINSCGENQNKENVLNFQEKPIYVQYIEE